MSDTSHDQMMSACLEREDPKMPPTPHIFQEDLFEATGESCEGNPIYVSIHGCIVQAQPKKAYNTLKRGQFSIQVEELRTQRETPFKSDLERSVEGVRIYLFIPLEFTRLKE